MIRKFNHIGVAVKDLEKTIKFFQEKYGAIVIWQGKSADEGYEWAFVAIGEAQLELVASLHPKSIISKFIETKGEGIHHISFEVDQFDQVIEDLKLKGLKIAREGDFEQCKIAFINPTSNFGILTEIIEPKLDWIPKKRN